MSRSYGDDFVFAAAASAVVVVVFVVWDCGYARCRRRLALLLLPCVVCVHRKARLLCAPILQQPIVRWYPPSN